MFVVVWFVVALRVFVHGFDHDQYFVPEPIINVYPKGFDVSIPDNEGIQLFAFHGNINEPMQGLSAGEFSKDIVKSTDGKWTFKERHAKLNPGDKIYYWLFVIRNNLGYRLDNGVYEVSGISPNSNKPDNHPVTKSPSPSKPPSKLEPKCEIVLLNLTSNLLDLNQELRQEKQENSVLRSIIESTPTPNALTFGGLLPYPGEDPMFVAINILTQKIGITKPVISAIYNPDRTIKFELKSLEDKIAVIEAAKEKLKNSRITLSYN